MIQIWFYNSEIIGEGGWGVFFLKKAVVLEDGSSSKKVGVEYRK